MQPGGQVQAENWQERYRNLDKSWKGRGGMRFERRDEHRKRKNLQRLLPQQVAELGRLATASAFDPRCPESRTARIASTLHRRISRDCDPGDQKSLGRGLVPASAKRCRSSISTVAITAQPARSARAFGNPDVPVLTPEH